MRYRQYHESVTLLNPTEEFIDGEVSYKSYLANAIIIEDNELGHLERNVFIPNLTFLLRCDIKPELESIIVYSNRQYKIARVKVCRAIDGKLECYRCETI